MLLIESLQSCLDIPTVNLEDIDSEIKVLYVGPLAEEEGSLDLLLVEFYVHECK